MQKKISIITLLTVKNYGSILQAYATQEKFKTYNLNVEFVNFKRADILDKNLIKIWSKGKFPISILKSLVILPTILKWRNIFGNFLKDNLNLTEDVYTQIEDFEKKPIIADIYCTGSDQTWNSNWNKGIIEPLFLNYAPENKVKISYAASFGKSELDSFEVNKTKALLSRYDRITVREKSAVNIIEKLGIKNSIHILDPTLVMEKQFWLNFAGNKKIKEPYYLIYQLNSNYDFDNYVKKLVKEKRIKLYRFCTRYDQFIKTGKSLLIPNVKDFVNAIAYADCIITDSFHATALSINLNRNFISIYPNEYSTRIDSILELTGLEHKHLCNYNDFFVADRKIDYEKVNKILDSERKKADGFLNEYLGGISGE